MPLIKDGRLRALATTTIKRPAVFPDIPTVHELLPGFEINSWYGLLAPGKTPTNVQARLTRDFVAALKQPDVIKQLRDRGIDASPSSPAEYLEFVRSEEKRWIPIIKAAGITAE